MPNLLKYILAAAVIGVTPSAHAAGTLVGTSVTGKYYPMGSSPGLFNTSVNYFDPVNGLVPAGYGNSSSATATITDPGIEFAAVDGGSIVTAPGITGYATDFTGSTITLTQYNNWPGNLAGFEEVFTDPAFAGLTVTKTSDNFANGPMIATLVGDTLTLSIAPNCLVGSGCSGWGKVGVASWALTKPTPPVIAIGNPSTNAGFPVGFNVNAVYSCTDALSGAAAASCSGTVPSGTALNTSTAGTQSFAVTATDLAGNSTTANTTYLISSLTLTTPGSIWTMQEMASKHLAETAELR